MTSPTATPTMARVGSVDTAAGDRPASLVLLSLLFLLPLFPPETHGVSGVGCAVLILLLVVLTARRRTGNTADVALVTGSLAAGALTLTGAAPGAAPEPVALALVAAGAGVHATVLGPTLARRLSVPAALAAVGGLVSVHALYQRTLGLEASAARLESLARFPEQAAMLERLREGRAFAAFVTPAALGGFLALSLPVTVGLALSRRGRVRGLLCGLAVLQAGGLLTAASATATAALLGATLLFVFVRRRGRRGLWVVTAVGIAALAAVVLLRGDRLLDTSDPNHPWTLRANNFRLASEIVRDHPWTGVGPGGFGEVYPGYRRPGDNEAQHAHDLPLELAAETGLPAALVLTGIFFAAFLGPALRRREAARWIDGAAVGLAAFALHNLADFTAFFPSLLWTAALLRGAIAARAPSAGADAGPAWSPVRVASLLVVAVAALVSAAGALAYEARFDARVGTVAADPVGAVGAAGRATAWAPWDPDGWLLRAQLSEGEADALEHVNRAIERSPVRPGARHLRARIRLRQGDPAGALADLLRAAELYPLETRYAEDRDQVRRELERLLGGEP